MYSDTPFDGRIGLLESPTTAIVLAFLRRFSPAAIALRHPHQFSHFFIREETELAGLQSSQIDRADADATQFLHQMPEMLEHDADLLVAPLNQLHFIPRIIAPPDQPYRSRRRTLSTEGIPVRNCSSSSAVSTPLIFTR